MTNSRHTRGLQHVGTRSSGKKTQSSNTFIGQPRARNKLFLFAPPRTEKQSGHIAPTTPLHSHKLYSHPAKEISTVHTCVELFTLFVCHPCDLSQVLKTPKRTTSYQAGGAAFRDTRSMFVEKNDCSPTSQPSRLLSSSLAYNVNSLHRINYIESITRQSSTFSKYIRTHTPAGDAHLCLLEDFAEHIPARLPVQVHVNVRGVLPSVRLEAARLDTLTSKTRRSQEVESSARYNSFSCHVLCVRFSTSLISSEVDSRG